MAPRDKVTDPKNPHAVALGRLGGQAKSAAKTKAARENAKLSHSTTNGRHKPSVVSARRRHDIERFLRQRLQDLLKEKKA